MPGLIDIELIEEFQDIMLVDKGEVSSEILMNVAEFDERHILEPSLRKILVDLTETPHGPTEIADILTHHVKVDGRQRFAAFVIKGKSFKKVTSRDVTHQFAKARQIESLDLIVFAAVGSIQDDARRDFLQAASDAGCDSVIADAVTLARLLIAYQIICPEDGLPFDSGGRCEKGHSRDEGLRFPDRRGPIRTYPRIIELGNRECRRVGILKVQNHTDDVHYKISICLTITDRSFSESDIKIIAPSPKKDFDVRIGNATVNPACLIIGGIDNLGRVNFWVLWDSLHPGEVVTFRVENHSDFMEPLRVIARIGHFSQEPPQVVQWNPGKILEEKFDEAQRLSRSGFHSEAIGKAWEADKYAREKFGLNHSAATVARNNLGVVHADAGKLVLARAHFHQALEMAEKSSGVTPDLRRNILLNLLDILPRLGGHDEAERVTEQLSLVTEEIDSE